MKIIYDDSEKALAQMLEHIQTDAGSWMCIHVNLASINGETLSADWLARDTMEQIKAASTTLAQKIYTQGVSRFEGTMFVFDDGDIVVMFQQPEFPYAELIQVFEKEFSSQQLGTIFKHYAMADKLASLIALSKEKQERGKELALKQEVFQAAENIFDSTEANPDLTRLILEKRRRRTEFVLLIIEDDVVARGLVSSALGKEYKVIQAKNAKIGMASYISNAPNLVLLDIHLPDHNGHNTLAKLKLLDPQAYVVMLSADSVVNNVLAARLTGAAGFIKKPFSKEKIVEYINKCPTKSSTATVLGWGDIIDRK
ncbi:MAG: response regulator [Pseudomonadota bacterium]|nr:response regulator [Pseudomonadota bacterium]